MSITQHNTSDAVIKGVTAEPIHVTFFRDAFAKTLSTKDMTLEALRDLILATTASEKGKLPWLKLAVFGEKKSDKGSLRHDANVITISGIELDYDGEKMSFNEAVDIAEGQRLWALLYTSPRHTAGKPRWRILLPTSRALPPEMRKKLVMRVNGLYGGIFSQESFTLSQAYYCGSVNSNPEHRAEVARSCIIHGGTGKVIDFPRRIDECNDLDAGALGKSGKPKPNGAGGAGHDEQTEDDVLIEKIRSGAEYHTSLVALSARLIGRGMDADSTIDLLCDLMKQSTGPRNKRWHDRFDSIPDDVASAVKKYGMVSASPSQAAGEPQDKAAGDSDQIKTDVSAAGTEAKEAKTKADPYVALLNKNYALVIVGDKIVVMKTSATDGIEFLTVTTFGQWFGNKFVQHGVTKAGEKIWVTLEKHWLSHKQRRQYEGLTFAPRRDVPNKYNLWRGFAITQRPGDCSKFLAHLHNNVCRNDEGLYKWVVGWFAQIFQQPENKMGTSLVLRGKQGTGKTKVGEVIGSLIGVHYVAVSDPRYVTGRFNSHLTSCLLLHADEGFWAGDHSAEGKLKDLITGNVHYIEYKGKEPIRVNNYVRLLVSGNPDWLVPAGFEERRFAVLEVGEAQITNAEYFAAIDAEMDAGGREALLDHLLRFDLKAEGINLRNIPKTAALLDQKLSSLGPEQGWWLDTLSRGELPWGVDELGRCPASRLFDRYIKHASRHGARRRSIEVQLGMFLRKHVPDLIKSEGTYRHWTGIGMKDTGGAVYTFPTLTVCRAAFAKTLGHDNIAWPEKSDWSLEPVPDPEPREVPF